MNLDVGLGQLTGKGKHVGVHRGGGPAKQRRRERREAERKSKATVVEKAAAALEKSDLLSEVTADEADEESDELLMSRSHRWMVDQMIVKKMSL